MNVKPNLLCVQPLHIDYPLFCYNIKKYRDLFAGVYVCLSDGHVTWLPDLSNFLTGAYKSIGAEVVRPRRTGTDWRDNAVRELVEVAPGPRLLFIEQDFLFTDSFINSVLTTPAEFIFYNEGGRTHPAFALVDKHTVMKTTQDFSSHPEMGLDHFGVFFQEVLRLVGTYASLYLLHFRPREDFYHLASLTQNYYNFIHGEQFYKPAEFLAYNYWVQEVNIEMNEDFDKLSLLIESKYGIGDSEGFIKKFFV